MVIKESFSTVFIPQHTAYCNTVINSNPALQRAKKAPARTAGQDLQRCQLCSTQHNAEALDSSSQVLNIPGPQSQWKTQPDLQFPGRGHCERRSLVLHLLLESVTNGLEGLGEKRGVFCLCFREKNSCTPSYLLIAIAMMTGSQPEYSTS